MYCPHCMGYISDKEKICPICGATVEQSAKPTGLYAIRQGRNSTFDPADTKPQEQTGGSRPQQKVQASDTDLHVYGEFGLEEIGGKPVDRAYDRFASRSEEDPRDTRQKPDRRWSKKKEDRERHSKQRDGQKNSRRRAPAPKKKGLLVNWTAVAILVVLLLIAMAVGAYLYLTRTYNGQLILARRGYDATSDALWAVGEEDLNKGSIEDAISCFLRAKEQDGTENLNVDGLLLLGSAYEAAGRQAEAMDIYQELYTDIVPNRSEPYRNMIRLLLAQDRKPEAAELMQTAYRMTGISSFLAQRTELLPSAPSVDLMAGYYDQKKTITLSSAEGFDIYYTFDENAELPGDGIRYAVPLLLDEGAHALRAVAVNEDLVSDPLSASYRIIMPSPGTPRCTLAPNTYKNRQKVRLRAAADNENDPDIVIYYTIDGSNPDADSPVWNGETIILPSGKVTLKAIAVNGYGKVSNQLEVLYKIEAKPFPLTAYSQEDTISKLSLYRTGREEFLKQYGEGDNREEILVDGFDQPCERRTYSWGYAVFGKKRQEWVLAELYFTSPQFAGPRGTAIGSSTEEIVSVFRDMGQIYSPSGNRGLYESDENYGKIYALSSGNSLIRYQTETTDSLLWRLDYCMNKAGFCYAIDWKLIH